MDRVLITKTSEERIRVLSLYKLCIVCCRIMDPQASDGTESVTDDPQGTRGLSEMHHVPKGVKLPTASKDLWP